MSQAPAYALSPEARDRIGKMLTLVAREVRRCKRCGRTIYMLPMRESGKVAPYTDDAVSHFADCPHADEFRR